MAYSTPRFRGSGCCIPNLPPPLRMASTSRHRHVFSLDGRGFIRSNSKRRSCQWWDHGIEFQGEEDEALCAFSVFVALRQNLRCNPSREASQTVSQKEIHVLPVVETRKAKLAPGMTPLVARKSQQNLATKKCCKQLANSTHTDIEAEGCSRGKTT